MAQNLYQMQVKPFRILCLLSCILSPISSTSTTDKFCVFGSNGIDGTYEYLYWDSTLDAAVFRNNVQNKYLFPWIGSSGYYYYLIGDTINDNINYDTYCIASNPSSSYTFNPHDCFQGSWVSESVNMRLINCNNICVSGIDYASIDLNGIYQFYTIYSAEDGAIYKLSTQSNIYLSPWIRSSDQGYGWQINSDYTSLQDYTYCNIGINPPTYYVFDLKDCGNWTTYINSVWQTDVGSDISRCDAETPYTCTDKCYYHDESTNTLGPSTCTNDCDCSSTRTCSASKICQGVSTFHDAPSCVGPPTESPTAYPTKYPSNIPTKFTKSPSKIPSNIPSNAPTQIPSNVPTNNPSKMPTNIPSINPSENPSLTPSQSPTAPSVRPTDIPSNTPSENPTKYPSLHPSGSPTEKVLILHQSPTKSPSLQPTIAVSETVTKASTTNERANVDSESKDNLLQSILSEPIHIVILSVLCCCLCVCAVIVYKICKKKKQRNPEQKQSTIDLAIPTSQTSPPTDTQMTDLNRIQSCSERETDNATNINNAAGDEDTKQTNTDYVMDNGENNYQHDGEKEDRLKYMIDDDSHSDDNIDIMYEKRRNNDNNQSDSDDSNDAMWNNDENNTTMGDNITTTGQ